MDYFNYRPSDLYTDLYAEDVSIAALANQFGTPLYIYSRATIERHWHAFDDGLANIPHLICYAVKANSNLAVLNIMARLGSGFDIVSMGELERVLAAGGLPEKIVFSGVGKTTAEIIRALECGILSFNVESEAELLRIETIAQAHKKVAPISIRVNPDVDAKTHPYISTGLKENKFGVAPDIALKMFAHAAKSAHLKIQGIDCHIGSQITELAPFLEALDRVLQLADQLEQQGVAISHLNMGGGVGVVYHDEQPVHPKEYSAAICARLQGRKLKLLLEPGRAIVANAGILVTKVEYLKIHHHKHFAIVDAAMNDLIRPAMYDAYHEIIPVTQGALGVTADYDIVGPVCETGDFLAKNRLLCLHSEQLLAIRTAGAYSFSMSSNYNSRPRVAEIMVDGTQAHLIRPRETVQELFADERVLP
jgi:diaminopimelate decarboxylase